MKAAVLLVTMASALAGCGGCGNTHAKPDAGADAGLPFNVCAGDPGAFVRQAFLALDGRRPKSQAEVDVYVNLYKAADQAGRDAKDTVARAIMAQPEFAERWVDVVMDAMQVQRTDIQTEQPCWDQGLRVGAPDPALAATIRDQQATGAGDGRPWAMIDLARSALALDDVSPIYRAQLFSLVSHPIPAANVPAREAELARRADFGTTFDAGFLHRNTVCLGCHNSERSVTDNDDPALDRFWPVPGLPERGVYGMSAGEDADRAHAAFRFDGFADVHNAHGHPWGWSPACGEFAAPAAVPDDIAGVDGKLASVAGMRVTVYDLEAALGRGFAQLRGRPPQLQPDGSIADPDAALAWLVTLKITEDLWKQVTGTSLTIANYFPRNQAASDQLYALASTLTTSNYSIRALLAAIVASDYFNRAPAEAGCGASPYTYPNVYDPWVISDPDPAKRHDGPGDAVTAVDPRTLISALDAALGWTAPPQATRFPDYGDPGCEDATSCSELGNDCNSFGACCNSYEAACQHGGVLPSVEMPFERGIGMFLRNSERGFRGLDFQARLIWEDRYGTCARPAWVTADVIDDLVAAGASDASATVGDVVAALKDRLIGEPAIAPGAETTAITAVVGALDGPASGIDATALRQLCGALIESPQFLLQGIAGKGGDRPRLTPAAAGYGAVCADLATRVAGIACANDMLTLM